MPPSDRLQPHLSGEASRVQPLSADAIQTRKELSERVVELRHLATERDALRTRLTHTEAKLSELSSALRAEAQLRNDFVDAHAKSSAALRARVATLESELSVLSEIELKCDTLQATLDERDEQVRELNERLTRADVKPTDERIGLRRIRGIGPAYERALLALGITMVEQIARLTPDEIERIAPQLKVQADRILRDNWVGQAQQLLGEDHASQKAPDLPGDLSADSGLNRG